MKTIILIATFACLGGSVVLADILLQSQVVIGGANAKAVNAKIAEVTHAEPQSFHGGKLLSAKADVYCTEYSNGEAACKIDIQK